MSSSINGILHQLLDDRGGALYHLTSSYLISHTIGKQLDYVCHCLTLFLGASRRLTSFSSEPAFLGRQLKISSLSNGRT